MNSEVKEMFGKRLVASGAGDRFAVELSHEEKCLIDRWLAKERSAEYPDEESWRRMLLGAKPFFKSHLEHILAGKWAEIVMYCATQLTLLNQQEVEKEFPVLGNQGVGFLLNGADPKYIGIFAGDYPILVDLVKRSDIWRLEAVGSDSIKIVGADLENVVSVALREWRLTAVKVRFARERLCDLFSLCFAQARS